MLMSVEALTPLRGREVGRARESCRRSARVLEGRGMLQLGRGWGQSVMTPAVESP
jgi:hypothetical protein